jgi:hypothetical protein
MGICSKSRAQKPLISRIILFHITGQSSHDSVLRGITSHWREAAIIPAQQFPRNGIAFDPCHSNLLWTISDYDIQAIDTSSASLSIVHHLSLPLLPTDFVNDFSVAHEMCVASSKLGRIFAWKAPYCSPPEYVDRGSSIVAIKIIDSSTFITGNVSGRLLAWKTNPLRIHRTFARPKVECVGVRQIEVDNAHNIYVLDMQGSLFVWKSVGSNGLLFQNVMSIAVRENLIFILKRDGDAGLGCVMAWNWQAEKISFTHLVARAAQTRVSWGLAHRLFCTTTRLLHYGEGGLEEYIFV